MSLLRYFVTRERGRELLGLLSAPGATPGDVLTVQSDRSLAPAAPEGGGSSTSIAGPVTLSAAQLRALSGSPIEMVPAPGAGHAIWPISWFVLYTFGTVQYASSEVQLRWGPDSGFILRIDLGDFSESSVQADSPSEGVANLTDAENQPMMLGSGDSFDDGDGTVSISVLYATVAV